MCQLNLFLDDERKPQDVNYALHSDWYIVRSYKEFCRFIRVQGVPQKVSFDYNLSENSKAIVKEDEKTGLDCLNFMLQFCIENRKPIPQILIHSNNEIARERMNSLLDTYAKYAHTLV